MDMMTDMEAKAQDTLATMKAATHEERRSLVVAQGPVANDRRYHEGLGAGRIVLQAGGPAPVRASQAGSKGVARTIAS